MVDVDAPVGDGLTMPLRLHNLLLVLAGRIDDSALSQAHELVARADADEAAELTAGTLIAGQIPVRAAERRELATVLEITRSDATLVDEVVVDELTPLNSHRFTGENAPERGVGQALERTVRVLPDVRSVHAVWRNTPAGAVPGPLPQRVVLVEVGPDGTPPAVAYRVETALRRAGISAVVDVLNAWTDRSSYHDAALASARQAWVAGPDAPTQHRAADRNPPERHASPSPPAHQAATHAAQPEPAAPPAPAEPAAHAEPAAPPAPAGPGAHAEPAAPAQSTRSTRPEQPWHSARSWQLANEGPSEQSEVEPAGFPASDHDSDPAPGAAAEASEASWDGAFTEPETAGTSETSETNVTGGTTAQERENRVASTAEMSPSEMDQLRQALAEDPDKGREIAATVRPGEVVEIPELDLNDPQLSDRDRELLRELHAELAARERAEAARHGVNGSQNA